MTYKEEVERKIANLSLEELLSLHLDYLCTGFADFRIFLNGAYNELCEAIKKGKGLSELEMILHYIIYHEEYIYLLPKEELYTVLNCVRLARSEGLKEAVNISSSEEYQKLEENYTNSR